MSQNKPSIKSLIVRLQKGNLILPVNLMAELVSVEKLTVTEHPGLEGWLEWRDRQIPVVSLESLCMLDDENHITGDSKCLIIHSVSNVGRLPFIALMVQGGLNMLDISPETLRDDHSGNVQRCPYVARQVRASHLLCFIPDLPAIEAVLMELVQADVSLQ